MLDRIRSEPALVVGLVETLLALAVSFGLGLEPEQIGAIVAVTTAVLAVVLRQKVSPVTGHSNG